MMKLLKNGLLLAVAGLFIFSACNPDEETADAVAPNVTLSIADEKDAYAPGDVIELKIDFTADAPAVGATISAETEEFNITIDGDGISEGILDLNAFNIASVKTGSFTIPGIVIPNETANSKLSFLVKIEDEEGRIGEGTLDIEVGEGLTHFSAMLLSAPLQDGAGSTGSKNSQTFFSTNTGETYSMKQINQSSAPLSVNIDFGYFYGTGAAGTKATIASPKHYSFEYGQAAWGTRNDTKIRKTTVTRSQFLESNLTLINDAFANGTPGNTAGRIVNLAEGDVLAFETDASKTGGAKKGLLLVESITAGDGENGKIEFSITMEK